MDFTDYLVKFFLVLSDSRVLILFTLVGFIALQRKIWGQALFILLFTMVLNTLLKNFFHVPLMPHLGKEGFAFPSGHMEAAVAFYGWLLLCYRHPIIRSLLLIILTGIGYSLIYFRYHTLFDVLGAIGFGSLSLFIYYHCTKIAVLHKYPPLLGLILCLLDIPILYYLHNTPPHVWMGFGALLGFSLTWAVFHQALTHRMQPVFTILCILASSVAIVSLYYAFPVIPGQNPIVTQLQWFYIGALLPAITRLFSISRART